MLTLSHLLADRSPATANIQVLVISCYWLCGSRRWYQVSKQFLDDSVCLSSCPASNFELTRFYEVTTSYRFFSSDGNCSSWGTRGTLSRLSGWEASETRTMGKRMRREKSSTGTRSPVRSTHRVVCASAQARNRELRVPSTGGACGPGCHAVYWAVPAARENPWANEARRKSAKILDSIRSLRGRATSCEEMLDSRGTDPVRPTRNRRFQPLRSGIVDTCTNDNSFCFR